MPETFPGQVRDGVVIFEGPSPLADGTRVEVKPIDMSEAIAQLSAALLEFAGAAEGRPPSLADRLRPVIGQAEGLPADLAENHDHYLHGLPRKS